MINEREKCRILLGCLAQNLNVNSKFLSVYKHVLFKAFSYKCALNNLEIEDGSIGGRLRHVILRSSTCKINCVVLSIDNSLFLINLHMFSLEAHFQNRGLPVIIQAENKNQEPKRLSTFASNCSKVESTFQRPETKPKSRIQAKRQAKQLSNTNRSRHGDQGHQTTQMLVTK